jgi:putative PIN family toxin of toxin-antitoxin system
VSHSELAKQTGAAAPVSLSPPPIVRVVLDTNVLLSLYVFADSRHLALRRALECGAWLALSDARCLAEFRQVIARPIFGLDATAQEAVFEAYAALAWPVEASPGERIALPPCKDPDDQKFLELARDGGASLLVTSDKALLKLARRRRLAHLFRILTPDAALALLVPDDSAIFATGGSPTDAHSRAGGHT